MKLKYICGLLLLLSQSAWASAIDELKAFYTNTHALEAQFEQTVSDRQGKKVQQVSGHMLLKRPNMFRWDYHKPYEQQIISDGTQVFLFDVDLQQVTVRTLGQALGSSPAALLAGGEDVTRAFTLKETTKKDGTHWVLATPKSKESGFEKVYLQLKEGQLLAMEMLDSFGQTTTIQFSKIDVHPKLRGEQFLFKIPENVDVVHD